MTVFDGAFACVVELSFGCVAQQPPRLRSAFASLRRHSFKSYHVPTSFPAGSVLREYYLFSLLAQRKKVVPKKKRRPLPNCSAGQRVSSTLLSFGAIERHGAGLSPYLLPDDVALLQGCCIYASIVGTPTTSTGSKRRHHGLSDSLRSGRGNAKLVGTL